VRTAVVLVAVGGSYLLIAVVLWWNAWAHGASTHTLCGCGDPALFLWFFQWPATAVAHLHNPFYSTALFHPGGVNLLSQTSVLGLSVPLVPVTWIFGPVAALNVASTLAPALSAGAAYFMIRRFVHWAPAAYVGGLLYGFSPFVLSSLEFAHLMTAAVMLLPLIVAAIDEILVRQHHAAWKVGLVLAVLLFWQFFLSTEMLAVLLLLVVIAIVILVLLALAGGSSERHRLRALLPHAVVGMSVGAGVGAVLLVYPVWFALEGPAHLPGLIWPNVNIQALGGFTGSSFVSADFIRGSNVYATLGGYDGSQLPSAGFLGWGLIGVLAAGWLIWFRDRRLWFFGLLLAVCVVFSLGERRGQLQPAHVLAHIPLLDNVIEQRFMIFGFLAAAAMLAVIVDHTRAELPSTLALRGTGGRVVGFGAATGVGALALVPMALTFAPTLPFAMQAVVLPRWYTTAAPTLPPGKVLLSYPAPFSGIQVSMAWQAVDAMSYDQAGGGGPQGVESRAGSARPGFITLKLLAFSVGVPQPTGSRAELADVRHALAVWQVNTVVIAPQPDAGYLVQGHDPTYAAAFMTAALGRLPRINAGAWEWDDVNVSGPAAPAPARVRPKGLKTCVAKDEKVTASTRATLRVARCVLAGSHTKSPVS
jgi:hypothetical protein